MEKIIIRNFTKLLALFLVVFLNIGAAPKLGKASYYHIIKWKAGIPQMEENIEKIVLLCTSYISIWNDIESAQSYKNSKTVVVR